jgi:hypothetical protein
MLQIPEIVTVDHPVLTGRRIVRPGLGLPVRDHIRRFEIVRPGLRDTMMNCRKHTTAASKTDEQYAERRSNIQKSGVFYVSRIIDQ